MQHRIFIVGTSLLNNYRKVYNTYVTEANLQSTEAAT